MPALLSIVGPTATGKTALAVALAQRLGAEVVSADSVQVYRQLDIGSGKATPEEMQGVPHHLISAIEPDQPYSAADFAEAARRVIDTLHQRSPWVVLAGGSGFYLQALLQGLDEMPPIPEAIRQALRAEHQAAGLAPLLEELLAADPETYARIDRQNPVRVLRALEVWRASGRPLSQWQKGGGGGLPCPVHTIGLRLDRPVLNARIDARVDAMVAAGWREEVVGLMARYGPGAPALGALSYREIAAQVLSGSPWEETVALVKLHTHQFAKRQMTWFQRDTRIHWLQADAPDLLDAAWATLPQP